MGYSVVLLLRMLEIQRTEKSPAYLPLISHYLSYYGLQLIEESLQKIFTTG